MGLWAIERPEGTAPRLTYTNASGARWVCGTILDQDDGVVFEWILRYGMWRDGDRVRFSDGVVATLPPALA